MTGLFQRTWYRRGKVQRIPSIAIVLAMAVCLLNLAPSSAIAQQPAEDAKTEETKEQQPPDAQPAGTQPSAAQPKDRRGAGARKGRTTATTDPAAQKQDEPAQDDGPKPAQPQPGKPPQPGGRPPRQPQVPVTAPAQPGGQPTGVPAGQPVAPPVVPAPTDGTQPTEARRPGPGGPDGAPPPSPTTALNIPPSQTDVPAEQRKYVFSIKDGTYEQLVEGFARQTGLGVLGEAPKDGKVTFVSTQELSFKEALSRIRMLLFNYKPLEPYWMRYEGTHLRVIRINDLYRELRPDQMFRSVDDFLAAGLADDELALVIYTPGGSIGDLRSVRDFLPDYVRVAPVGANSVTIFALVKDIKRYLDFIKIFDVGSDDPRTLERIEVKHVLPSEAVARLQQLMDLAGGGAAPVRPQPVRAGAQPSAVDFTMADPPLTMLPDDIQGVIIVRAMRNKLAEIHKLLPFIDVDTSAGALETVVIPVENADPGELVATIQQILTATASSTAGDGVSMSTPPSGPSPGGAVKPGGARPVRKAGPAPMGTEGVTMIVHPSQSAIIVVANAETITRVRNYVTQFDVPGGVGPVKIPVTYGDPNDLVNTMINVIFSQSGAKGQPAMERFGVVPDAANNCIWFRGPQKDLDKVRELMAQLDVAGEAVTLRTVRFKSQLPSFVASMLREYDQEQAAPVAVPQPGKPSPPRSAKTISASKFTPNDEQGILYILCTDAEWEHYKPVLEGLEGSVESTPPYVKLPLEHLDPQTAADQLMVLLAGNDPKSISIRFVATDKGVFVIGADKTRLETIQGFLAELDRPVTIEARTFEIRYGDPAEIKIAIDALVGGDPTGQGRAPRPALAPGARPAPTTPTVYPSLTVVQLGNRLFVRATPKVMAEVARLVTELDVETGKTTVKVYRDFPPGANIESIADNLAGIFSTPVPPGTPPRRGIRGQAEGPRFLPRVAAGELVVIAEPTLLPRIEELLEILRKGAQQENYVVEFIDVAHAEPEQLVELMIPLLDLTARQLVATGVLREATGPDPQVLPVPGPRPRSGPGEAAHDYFHLDTDQRNRRLVIAAPKVLVDEARKLAFDLDKAGSDHVFRWVHLKNADPAEMVSAVRQISGDSRRSAHGRSAASALKPVPAPAAVTQVFDSMSDGPLSVFEAPGGGAIVLHGPPKDVERAVKWIEQLDAISTRGRMIRVYNIRRADVRELAELILSMVDLPVARAPAIKAPAVKPAGGFLGGAAEEDDEVWETTKTWIGQELFLRGDFVAKTLIVGAPPTKMSYIDDLIQQFDPEQGPTPIEIVKKPKVLYDLVNAEDADDVAFSAELFFDQYCKGEEKPEVDAGFGNTLIVSHSDETKLAEFVGIIREKIDVADPEKSKPIRRTLAVPSGISTEQAVLWLKINHPEVEFDIEAIARPEDDRPRLKTLERYVPADVHPCVLPLSSSRAMENVLTSLFAVQQPEEHEGEQPVPEPPPVVLPPVNIQPDYLQQAGVQLMQGKTTQSSDEKEKDKDRTKDKPGAKTPKGTKLRVEFQKEDNTFKIEGPAGVVEDVKDWLKDLEKEVETMKVKPDIRIYRLTYIDVETAADVLEEMFNATRQQREAFGQQQQLMQAQMRQQQQLQQQQAARQQQQPPGQPPGKGQPPGTPGRPDQPTGQQPQTQMPGMPQLPATSVRVYPYPREHALILRADTSDYPTIEELLATIDRPKPIDSEFKIFPLKKLNAVEVEELLSEMLGLDQRASPQAAAAAAGGVPGGGGGRRGASGAPTVPELPQKLMQELSVGQGELQVDPKDIKLSSNEAANTLLVMAPKRAIEFIGGIIDKLESGDMPERIPRHYELKFADAEEVADYLSRHYEESPMGGGTRKGAPGGAVGGPAGKSLNTPSFVAYPRLNLLTVLATVEQHQKIDEIITRLDVKQAAEKWEDVSLTNVDAKFAADTLDKMFGSGAARGGSAKGAAAPTGGGQAARFVGDEGGRVLFFSAPQSLREPILATIQKLEEEAKGTTSVRVIELKFAAPSKVAEAIDGAYGGGPSAKGKPRSGNVNFTISSHDPSRRLFVKADDATFAKIESLAKSLDRPTPIDVELRVYPLRFANARQVHTTMTKMLKDYMTRLGPGGLGEAFSVEADDRANALVALGNETVFKFLEETLPKIDNPAAATGQISFMMHTVKSGDAAELAQNIQQLYNEKTLQGETPPQVNANRSANVIMIRGTKGQLAEILRDVIEPYEKQAPTVLQTQTIRLKFADAEAVAESINQVFEDLKKAYDQMAGQGPKVPARQFTVIVTPDANTKQVTIHASAENMELVKARIAELDQADVAETIATTVKIYPVKFADANAVVRIIADWSKSRPQPPQGSKKQGEVVIATAEPVTKSVVVTTSHSNHLIIQEMIAGLDKEELVLRGAEQMKSFHLNHADPATVQDAISQLFKTSGPGRPPVIAVADYGSRSVLVSASSQDLVRVEDLISKIDTVESTKLAVHVIKIQNAGAESVARTLTDIWVKTAPQRGGAQTPAVSISALQGSQAVLVKCNPKDFADIEATVKQLDSEGAAFGEVTKVIPLLYGDATEAQQALEKTLKKPESAGSRGGELLGDARVSVLTQSNAVVVSGTKEVVARIEGMVKEWDDAGEKGSVPQIIQLKHVEPGQIAASLQDMFAQQPTTQRGKVPPVIIPDEANRSLLVRSSLQDLTVIESLVAKMDLEGRKYENFFVVQVAQGTDVEDLADKVETSVNESAQRRPGQRGRDAPSLTATPDRRTNSIILAGSPSLFADARQLIQAMEKMTPPGGKTIRVISADTVPVDDLKRLIDQLQGDQQGRRGGGGGSRPSGGGTRRPRSEPARPGP